MEDLIENKQGELNSEILERRKEKLGKLFKNPAFFIAVFLIIAVILGVYIRSLPMQDHGGRPGLWDISTDNWTLGPDLDPWLFVRTADSIVKTGSIPEIDTFRYVPLGFATSRETVLLPYMIAWTYSISKIFYSGTTIEFAGDIFPVVMFALTIMSFFLFSRELFLGKTKRSRLRAGAIALVSTFLMVVMPVFLSRTIAGIPEKESAAFFFLFLALFFFLKSWKTETIKKGVMFGILAGLATAGMALISGLHIYIFLSIFLSGFLAFILNKFGRKERIVYTVWWISAAIPLSTLPGKVSLTALLTSLTIAPAFLLLVIIWAHFLIWKTKISRNRFLERVRLPKNITSIIITLLLGIIVVLILKPSLIAQKITAINNIVFNPIVGRWNTTVAENRQPFFKEWVGSFGPFFNGIPVMFWLLFVGSIVLFNNMIKGIKKSDRLKLDLLFIFFLSGLMFSRYSSSGLFNGENLISKGFYLLSVLFLLGYLVYSYINYYKEGNKSFEEIDYSLLLILSLFVLAAFSARSAIRLVMVLGAVSPILAGYLLDQSIFSFRHSKETKKVIMGIILVLVAFAILFTFTKYYGIVKSNAYNSVPSYYNQQWQKAMSWVRNSTPTDAVFAHWWDYGYWVQSIGHRPTVVDGGNAISFWNYYVGRLVLTGDNQEDSLEFLYNHNADYLLIDSSDIGKYGAFSSIGSDENFDRFSYIPSLTLDSRQTRETSTGVIKVYAGGVALDEDLTYDSNGTELFFPSQRAGIGGIILESSENEGKITFKQPKAAFIYNGVQQNIPMRYLEYNGNFIDFGSGIEGTAKLIQKINVVNGGVQVDDTGSIIYISPRVMRGYFAQKYLLDDPFHKFPNFELAHTEQNIIIQNLNDQGLNLREFVDYQGIQGPIKIWSIKYTGNEKEKPEYIDTDSSKYLSWKL